MTTLTGIDLVATPGNVPLANASSRWTSQALTGAITVSSAGLVTLNYNSLYNFSAGLATFATGTGTALLPLTGWNVTAPFFTSAGSGFNSTTGVWTVPQTGKYSFAISINYALSGLGLAVGGASVPRFIVQRTSPSSTLLLVGVVPILSITLIRALLSSGQIQLSGDLTLTQNDSLTLYYDPQTTSLNIPLSNIVYSVKSMF